MIEWLFSFATPTCNLLTKHEVSIYSTKSFQIFIWNLRDPCCTKPDIFSVTCNILIQYSIRKVNLFKFLHFFHDTKLHLRRDTIWDKVLITDSFLKDNIRFITNENLCDALHNKVRYWRKTVYFCLFMYVCVYNLHVKIWEK